MKKATTKRIFRTLATRSVLAALPVAMVSAYASNSFVPTPPRIASYEYRQVAEIVVAPSTVGIAASPLPPNRRQPSKRNSTTCSRSA